MQIGGSAPGTLLLPPEAVAQGHAATARCGVLLCAICGSDVGVNQAAHRPREQPTDATIGPDGRYP
jgi:hypothetical protein